MTVNAIKTRKPAAHRNKGIGRTRKHKRPRSATDDDDDDDDDFVLID